MPEDANTPTPKPTPPDPIPSDPPPASEPTPQGPTPSAPAAGSAPAEDVSTLPEWAQKHLAEIRKEAAGYRTKATEAATKHQATLDAIGEALGLKKSDDPAQAAKTAAAERDAAREEAKVLKAENAVLRIAAKHGASPEALTDSRSFMSELEKIDPNADDFANQLEAAIKTAIEANPSLKAAGAPAAPARSGSPVGGGAPVGGEKTVEDFVAEFNKPT